MEFLLFGAFSHMYSVYIMCSRMQLSRDSVVCSHCQEVPHRGLQRALLELAFCLLEAWSGHTHPSLPLPGCDRSLLVWNCWLHTALFVDLVLHVHHWMLSCNAEPFAPHLVVWNCLVVLRMALVPSSADWSDLLIIANHLCSLNRCGLYYLEKTWHL